MAGASVRNLETMVVVSRGQEERNPALMAVISVALVGKKRVACKNCRACWMYFVVWTLVMALMLCFCWLCF